MQQLALLGTGLMGRPMAERLLAQGFSLTVYNRSPEKAAALQPMGAVLAPRPAEALANAKTILLMLSDYAAIEQVLPAKFDYSGKTVIQMGTIAPSESQALALRLQQQGAEYLEAPVLGSKPQAREGTLIIMVGGEENTFQKSKPIFEALGNTLFYIGPTGQAAAMKLALNQMIPAHIALFGLSFQYLKQQGVSAHLFMEVLRKSALYAPAYDKKLPRLESDNYDDPNFPVKHMIKDMNLFIDQAQTGLDPRMAQACLELLKKALDMGLGEADYSAIAQAVGCPK